MYTDELDVEEQVTMEERIAAIIYDNPDVETDEHTAQDLGRQLLLEVLKVFRPEVIAD